MHTVDRQPRHLTPNVDESWLYRLPSDECEPVTDWDTPDDLDVLLDLAAEKPWIKVA
jgi:hypothetical protein